MDAAQEDAKLLYWCRGDENAALCLKHLARLSQNLDDLVDQDQGHSLEERSRLVVLIVDAVFKRLPENPYWAARSERLTPLLVSGTLEWDCSNEWQHGDQQQQLFGFVRRESLDSVVAAVATDLGGPDWGRHVAREVHEFYHVQHQEGENVISWSAERATR